MPVGVANLGLVLLANGQFDSQVIVGVVAFVVRLAGEDDLARGICQFDFRSAVAARRGDRARET